METAGRVDGASEGPEDLSGVAERAVALVDEWLISAVGRETANERRTTNRLAGVVADPVGVEFAMAFVDRVIRPEDNRVAAGQLASLVQGQELPAFLSRIDQLLLRVGARVGRILPTVVMPLARRRMRSLVGHLIVDADESALHEHLGARRSEGFLLNVNLLGEAVLGEREAQRRHAETLRLLEQGAVDYVSVKVSSVVSQLNYWDFEGCVDRVLEALRPLFERAQRTDPETFINLDMEEYHDLELTMRAFQALLDEPRFHTVDAGIVLQAYLPDSFDALRSLSAWANDRGRRTVEGKRGGTVKVRLVKGANLAMERVEAEIHGWGHAPYESKAETDANYKRCLDWVLTPERLGSMSVGVASHNLFDLAFAKLLAEERGVADRVEFEMLEGMAPGHSRLLGDDDAGMLLYTPVVSADQFDVAISYLFRRLEENASDENFIHHLFSLRPGSVAAKREADRFRKAVRDRWTVRSSPNRRQDRHFPPEVAPTGSFTNASDTDPAIAANRAWVAEALGQTDTTPRNGIVGVTNGVDDVVALARSGHTSWSHRGAEQRREILFAVANELERRRGDLVATMVHEARKTVAQADPEVSEAVDFARYYGQRAMDLDAVEGATFEPFGVVLVAPPWNFPVAIPTGGVMASLAAGNSVILKPAPETPRCAEIVAESCWAAGVPRDAIQFLRVPDDETGRHLVSHPGVDAVILTGAYETAELFRSWRPDLRIFAETSGKNSLIVTPNADLDLAVADLVASAFGHAGQKCSAASLAILVGDVHRSERFRRQLVDAVSSLKVGPSEDLSTTMGPTTTEPTDKLVRALTQLDSGEQWLVHPRELAPGTWTPGVKDDVVPGSWFHQTECFGPVLGLVRAGDLAEAVAIQNATPFGLTGGIHSLDDGEIQYWLERVEVGNAYVNRATTGAIVQRQPFGGWKRSTIGPGAKAGGPNYVAQLGVWRASPGLVETEEWLERAVANDVAVWADEFGLEHDPTGLPCESNRFRYRPAGRVVIRVGAGGEIAGRRALAAAERCGCDVVVSSAAEESTQHLVDRLSEIGPDRIRVIGSTDPAIRQCASDLGIYIADAPVVANGRIELLHYLREQAISQTTHRYGNLVSSQSVRS
ncbi:MAG: bifunctional proline dehydrogenase/L-glutamate gamma-semialdehyde dehydrogenase [Actinomycetia bacterium]|nr:bifunctional proline dehydrogenase/L-glutamate gamma-semialdehyde dehydrogenase [Actinomycetes bacterium]